MKVGVLTLPLWNNYGGIIQSYALKDTLEKMNYEVWLIDYHHPKLSFFESYKRDLKKKIKRTIKPNATIYPNVKENSYISQETLKFIQNEFVNKTSRIQSKVELSEQTSFLDAVIVGSDQVWRPGYTPNIYSYFLDFCHSSQLKISYAASFGTDQFLFNQDQKVRCKSLLNDFNAVSVREDSGVKLCTEHFSKASTQLVDPTLLLSVSDYEEIINRYNTEKCSGNLFTYILDEEANKKLVIDKVVKKTGLDPFSLMPKKYDSKFSFEDASYIFPSLPQWLKSFKDSEYIITDSFHGCVFAIIFNKPFIAIGNTERGLARFNSLLKLFGLEDRLIVSESIEDKFIHAKIDWEIVNKVMLRERKKSREFLIKALKNES